MAAYRIEPIRTLSMQVDVLLPLPGSHAAGRRPVQTGFMDILPMRRPRVVNTWTRRNAHAGALVLAGQVHRMGAPFRLNANGRM